jgi:glutamine synthetase
VFLPERLDDQERFLALVEEYAAAQDVTLKGTVAEYAPSQFEVNLGHGRDMTRAADEAVMLKRLVRAAPAPPASAPPSCQAVRGAERQRPARPRQPG